MMGWITAILASGPARRALGLLLAAITIALFLLNLRRAGERAGRLAERLSTSERTHEIQRQMLDAASRRPADRDALAGRLRDGQF
jgi:heme A synthase